VSKYCWLIDIAKTRPAVFIIDDFGGDWILLVKEIACNLSALTVSLGGVITHCRTTEQEKQKHRHGTHTCLVLSQPTAT